MANVAGPDQARSWAIAVAAFVINALICGISRANGLLYISLIRNYGVTRLQANLPFTVRNVVRNLTVPFVGILCQRYGSRDVTIIGSIFASVGASACFLVPNVIWICILWGGVHGLGVALGSSLFQDVINQHFQKHLVSASGLAFFGGCVGSFIFPVILKYLLKEVGLQGTFLLTGGLILNALPAAMLMKAPPWFKDFFDKDKNEQAKSNRHEIQRNSTAETTSRSNVHGINEMLPRSKACAKSKDDDQWYGNQESRAVKKTNKVLYRRSISADTIQTTDPLQLSACKEIRQLFQAPMFYMISLSLISFIMLFDPSITVIIDYVTDKGLNEKAGTYFIITMSLADFFGRVCFGWVTLPDGGYLSLASFMVLVHVIQGLCFILLPFFSIFEVLMAVLIVYGIAAGSTLVMYPVLVAKYLSSVQSLAIGCISVVGGISALMILPLIGHFRDGIGSYDGMFYTMGGISLLTGILWMFEPLVIKLGRKHEETTKDDFFY